MRLLLKVLIMLLPPVFAGAQTISYTISFPNAVHHEGLVTASFSGVQTDTLDLRMSRTSPGRYALHEFAKNVYGLEATDGNGKTLQVFRPDPYSWQVVGHNGKVHVQYILYADRADGTYSQIDETHAHLNIPATFLYAPEFAESPLEVTFNVREDLSWKVATQLPLVSGTTYSAPNLQYFMDSPTEISDFSIREFPVNSNGNTYTIQFVLHHYGQESSFDTYVEQVKKIVEEERAVFGEYPSFDHGRYTFLACYLPHASGDGMEHRNSTVLSSTRALEEGGMAGNIGTVSHEFFHAWNVERLRPASLEPFNFEKANMSGALWFAEGFTSYYTNLILCRAGIISPEAYVADLAPSFNYVWNSPAREFFNPIQMSYQAPFVDAATSVDPVNRENTFISYYTYGSMLGLALDLSLRQQGLTLDGYMKSLWDAFGREERPYTIEDLHNSLNRYAGNAFGDRYFDQFIYKSGMPGYEALFKTVGVVLKRDEDAAWLGISTSIGENGMPVIVNNPLKGSPAYMAGLEKGDILLSVNGLPMESGKTPTLPAFGRGDSLQVRYRSRGQERKTIVVAAPHPSYTIGLAESYGETPSNEILQARKSWLGL